MAAKLCQTCKGAGEIPITSCNPIDSLVPCQITWLKCKDCNGEGYITISTNKEYLTNEKTDP